MFEDLSRKRKRDTAAMTTEEYGEKHEGQCKSVPEIPEIFPEIPENDNVTENSPNDAAETVLNVEDEQEEEQQQEQGTNKLWYNGNLFKCNKCQAVGNLDSTAFPHAGKCGDDKLQLKRTSDSMYGCKICSESVYHDYFAIGFHMRQQHKMNIDEYGRQHELAFCGVCMKSVPGDGESFKEHMTKHSKKKLNIKNEPNMTNG